jgi:predicted PhzF superfamily epimerase YddE/YHI9
MTTVPVFWVDAFTDRRFAGNPGAVCVLDEAIDEREMQGLAFELGISETGYVVPEGDGWSLRWFTPQVEVDLCGHVTLAAAHVLREQQRLADGDTAHFHTRSGVLGATVDGDRIELDLPASAPVAVALPDELAGIGVQGGGGWRAFDLLVELQDARAVRSFAPDLGALRRLPDRALIVTAAADEPGTDYVLRVFGPKVGIDEDPATGSAQCIAGPFWAERLGRNVLEAEQCSDRGGRFRVTVDGDRVRVAGRAVIVLRGTVDLG